MPARPQCPSRPARKTSGSIPQPSSRTRMCRSVSAYSSSNSTLRAGVTKCVDQSFAADPVNLLAYGRTQGLLPPGDGDEEIGSGLDRQFFLNAGQGQNQVHWTSIRGAQMLNGVTALLYPLVHDLQNTVEPWFERAVYGWAVQSHSQLHRGADEGLQECVMQFLGDASTLFQADVLFADAFFFLFA